MVAGVRKETAYNGMGSDASIDVEWKIQRQAVGKARAQFQDGAKLGL